MVMYISCGEFLIPRFDGRGTGTRVMCSHFTIHLFSSVRDFGINITEHIFNFFFYPTTTLPLLLGHRAPSAGLSPSAAIKVIISYLLRDPHNNHGPKQQQQQCPAKPHQQSKTTIAIKDHYYYYSGTKT